MFHKIKNANPLQDFRLCVLFSEGVTKIYDVKPLFEKISAFKVFAETPGIRSAKIIKDDSPLSILRKNVII